MCNHENKTLVTNGGICVQNNGYSGGGSAYWRKCGIGAWRRKYRHARRGARKRLMAWRGGHLRLWLPAGWRDAMAGQKAQTSARKSGGSCQS